MQTKNTGIYTAYSVSEDGIETLLGSTENLVVDSGIDLINRSGDSVILHTCIVSSDNTAITSTTNSIPGIVARTSTRMHDTYGAQDSAPYYLWYRTTFEFGVGAANGNLTKVGITDSSGTLFSVAMFRDNEGQPVTIQPMERERLRVVYEYRVYISTEDVVFSDVQVFPQRDELYKITIRPADITSGSLAQYLDRGLYITYDLDAYLGNIAPITTSPNNRVQTKDGFRSKSYTNGDHSRTYLLSGGYSDFNHSEGIASMRIRTSRGNYQVGFNPPLKKTNQELLNLSFTIVTGR